MTNLNDFLEYVGPVDSLYGYNRSYKIVLLIHMLELVDSEGKIQQDKLYINIQQFYIRRNNSNLKAEFSDSDIQREINNLTLETVKRVMNSNSFKVIKDKGFINKKQVGNQDYIYFVPELWNELKLYDKEELIQILKEKLQLYYKTYVEGDHVNTLHKYVSDIMDKYLNARVGEEFTNHKLGKLLRHEIPEYIEELSIIDIERYSARGTIGAGGWTKTPWIAILDSRIGATMQDGIYIVYLFSSDMERVYLTLNQGVTNYSNSHSKKETIDYLENVAREIRKYFDSNKATLNNNIVLNGTSTADLYEKGTIAYIEYKKGRIPEEKELLQDLAYFISVYNSYANSILTTSINKQKTEPNLKDNEVEDMEHKEIIEHVYKYIFAQGFKYSIDEITNFYLCLKSKPFVLLAGISGTGKSKLVQLFAEALGSTSENGRFNIIPVRPDWSDPSDLLGYRNLEGNFQPGPLTTIIKRAIENQTLPYFVCLDEMNLARVEYYFSDILSIIETRKFNNGIVTDKLFKDEFFGKDKSSRELFGQLYLPDNLYIIGTVNMDETTFPFSKKVLDRANTIEFNKVDLGINFDEFDYDSENIKSISLSSAKICSKYIKLVDCIKEKDHIEKVIYILEKINNILEKVGLQFGYRVRDEIIFYSLYAINEDLMDFDKAIDYAIKQKVLPRIQGSNLSIKEVLIELFMLFVKNDNKVYDPYDDKNWEKMSAYIKQNTVSYSLCAEKICKMVRRYEIDGFTTFWE